MTKNLKVLSLVFIMIPILIHVFFLDRYEINFPFEDSHYVYFNFLYEYLQVPTFSEKLKLSLSTINESRPILMRLITLGEYYLLGEFNFKYTLLFSNFYLLIILWVFYKKYFSSSHWILIAVAFFSILSLCNFENFYRNDVLLYQTASISLSVLIFYLISLPFSSLSKFFKIILFLSIILVPFGSAIGYFTIFMVLAYGYFFEKRSLFYPTLIVLGFHVLFIVFLSEPNNNPGNQGLFDNLIKYNYKLVLAFFISLGGCFQLFSNNTGFLISAIGGLILMVLPVVIFFKIKNKSDFYFEILLYLFSIICIAAIVYKRYGFWTVGYESVLVSRYKIYGSLVFIVCGALLLKTYEKKVVKSLLLFCTLILYTVWLLKTPTVLNQKKETQLMDIYSTKNKVGVRQSTNILYIDTDIYDYLVEKKVFDPTEANTFLDKQLIGGTYIKPDSIIYGEVGFDPGFEAAWSGRKSKLKKIIVRGNFGKANNYFILITDNNNKKVLLNALPKSISIAKKIFNAKQNTLELSKEFDNQFFRLKQPVRAEVLATDIYK